MTADLLALLDRDPAAGILAVADLREQRATDAQDVTGEGRWVLVLGAEYEVHAPTERACVAISEEVAEHIAAEGNPAHARAAVRRWRGVASRHPVFRSPSSEDGYSLFCRGHSDFRAVADCPDLVETADEARAYAGGAA